MNNSVQGSLSVRFDAVLGDGERSRFAAALDSQRARLVSWKPWPPAGRTYARIAYGGDRPRVEDLASPPPSAVDDPALLVLAIEPADPRACPRLAAALGGDGRPAGVVSAEEVEAAVLVEFDPRLTPLSLVVDVIDAELAHAPGRRIVPLIALDDDVLAEFAAATLAEPAIDRTRILETYLEPLLEGAGTC